MASNFRKFILLGFIFVLPFCFVIETTAQKPKIKLMTADKKEIIRILLEERFAGSDKETIKISTKNLPSEIKKDFPKIADLNIRLASEIPSDSSDCAYQFGKFSAVNKYISLEFGSVECGESLLYDFIKVDGKWKSAPFIIEN